MIDQVQEAKNLAAEHDSSVSQPAGAASLDGSSSGHMMYEKRPYPKFDEGELPQLQEGVE